MSTERTPVQNRWGGAGSPQVVAEIFRVRQRASARLGSGIHPRVVKRIIGKLDLERKDR